MLLHSLPFIRNHRTNYNEIFDTASSQGVYGPYTRLLEPDRPTWHKFLSNFSVFFRTHYKVLGGFHGHNFATICDTPALFESQLSRD